MISGARTPAAVRQLGMTAAEQQAAAKERVGTDVPFPADVEAQKARLAKAGKTTIQAGVPGLGGTPAGPNAQLTGDEYLKTLPPALAAQVRGIAEGRSTIPSAASRSQTAPLIRNAVFQYDPEFSEQRAQIRKAFTSGTDGRNIGALNTATVHLDQFADAADAMRNGSFRPGNEIFNRLALEFGGSAYGHRDGSGN